jgi:hypothetical protein
MEAHLQALVVKLRAVQGTASEGQFKQHAIQVGFSSKLEPCKLDRAAITQVRAQSMGC